MSEIEPYRPQKRQYVKVVALGLVLIFGVAIGVLIAPNFGQKRATNLAIGTGLPPDERPPETAPGEQESPPAPPSDETNATPETKLPPDADTKANPAADPNTKANPATSGGPSPLTGSLPGGTTSSGVGPVNPIVIESPEVRAPSAQYFEYLIIVAEVDVAPMVQRVTGAIRSAGGQMHLQFTHDPERPELGQEAIAAINSDSAGKLADELLKIDRAVETDRWSGPLEDRQLRAQRFLRDAVNQMDRRIRELQVRFLDDAPEVVRLTEARDRYRQGLQSFRKVPAGKEIIRIYVGKALPPWR